MPDDIELPAMPFGRTYYRWCQTINGRFGPRDEKKIQETLRKREERFRRGEQRFREAQRAFDEIQMKYFSTEPEYQRAEKAFRRAKKRFEAAQRNFEHPSFVKAMKFLGWSIQHDNAIFFATMVTLLICVPALLAFLLWLFFAQPDATSVLTFAPVILVALPVGLFVFLATFPERLEKSVRIYSLGKSPEAVSYLSMSMRLTPSLSRAVSFAAENCEEPVASALDKVSWDVYLRRFATTEEAFLHMAHEWGQWNDDLRRSFHTIRGAALEQTTEGLDRSLEKANDIILTGTKQKIEHFVAGLSGPTTILFALGVLLPMTIGAALPLMSISIAPPVAGGADVTTRSAPASINPAPIVLLMDILFPFVAFAYAYSILGKRPGTSSPPEVRRKIPHATLKRIQFLSASIGTAFVVLGIFSVATLPGTPPEEPTLWEALRQTIGPLPILWGVAIGAGSYLLATTRTQKKERDEVLALEEEFPDGLFQLGSRITEGHAQEKAIEMTARALQGTRVADLFAHIAHRAKVNRSTLEKVLFGQDGMMEKYPSRMIKASMKVVTEVSKKDSKTAGRTIIGISHYLKDMKKIEKDIRINLKASADNMKATGVIFAPLVMGVTVALYGYLFAVFSNLGALIPTSMIPVPQFQLIIGLFLLAMVAVIMYYVAGIEWGEDWVERRYLIGAALPVAVTIFSLTVLATGVFFAG